MGFFEQKHLCKFGSLSPAGTFVSPRLREAATTLGASGRQCGGEAKTKENTEILQRTSDSTLEL